MWLVGFLCACVNPAPCSRLVLMSLRVTNGGGLGGGGGGRCDSHAFSIWCGHHHTNRSRVAVSALASACKACFQQQPNSFRKDAKAEFVLGGNVRLIMVNVLQNGGLTLLAYTSGHSRYVWQLVHTVFRELLDHLTWWSRLFCVKYVEMQSTAHSFGLN